MTEKVSVDEEIVERKTIVYKTLVDPTVIKIAAEKLKNKLFVRFGFLKPRPEEIEFVSIDKYYEPYILISGKYAIDYYRERVYTINVDQRVREVILLNKKFKPERTKDSSAGYNAVRLEGQERLVYGGKTSIVLDRSGREVLLEKLPSAPSEENPKKMFAELGDKVKKLEVAPEADVDVIRSKIFKRPQDVKRIVSEQFEVDERALIYTPIYRTLFRNLKTGEVKTIEFDGVTSKRIQQK